MQTTFDPEISEWGNPVPLAEPSIGEFIAGGKPTEGSETSQYLQEEKVTTIALVAASERATA